ncbi:hypothetical protein FACS1894166_00900 [Bacilli bacterium]|nr:hypothetical protein FACS1894166_00900 [Bacilli bacterium]
MSKIDRINYDESLIIRIITNIIQKTPGISVDDELNVAVSDKHNSIDVTLAPLNNIINVYDLAKKLQESIYYQVIKIFDLLDIVVNVRVKKGHE